MPKIEMNMLELPEGWEYTGEYNSSDGLPWVDDDGEIRTDLVYTKVPIVRRVPKLRPAKIEDIDKGLQCRTRDIADDQWRASGTDNCTLTGWDGNKKQWLCSCGNWWNFCEVLDK
jgi:hypothetical protein